MLRKIGLFFLFMAIIFTGVTAYAVWKNTLPLVSPVALIEVITGNSTAAKSPKIVYGFFPYWNTKLADELNIGSLTHFAYFAVDLNPDGSINKINNQKEQEPGWNKLNSQAVGRLLYQSKLLGQKTVLTVTAMEQELIESLADDPKNAKKAVASILQVYQEKNFDDINVDFEYVGEPKVKTRNGFTSFVQSLKSACLSINPKCQIDVDIFADTAEEFRLWDLAALEPFTDRFIVMAYDYHRKSSTVSGPVAPITGKCNYESPEYPCLNQDIVTHISQITKLIPPEKTILGVPFYGYQWQTASRDFMANTYPGTGSLATYGRVQNIFSDTEVSSLSARWSDLTLSPYLVFEMEKKTYQIQFENRQSLEQKTKLVKSANLGGIAIWALGYESTFQDIWQPIKDLSTP